MQNQLIVMRLIDMHRMHPQQINNHVCSKCKQKVGIYPSGQKILKKQPDLEIVCSRCVDISEKILSQPAAASFHEVIEESRASYDVNKRKQ
jgi:hypothetical protein